MGGSAEDNLLAPPGVKEGDLEEEEAAAALEEEDGNDEGDSGVRSPLALLKLACCTKLCFVTLEMGGMIGESEGGNSD